MWVSWESDVITVISYSPLGDYAVSQIPFYKGNVNGKSTVVYDEVHVAMNTYATSARFCAYADRSCNKEQQQARLSPVAVIHISWFKCRFHVAMCDSRKEGV